MRAIHSDHFKKSFNNFSIDIQRKFEKQAMYLLSDLRHPSLHAKKYNEPNGVWQARVDKNIRFYFAIENDTYILLDIKRHSK